MSLRRAAAPAAWGLRTYAQSAAWLTVAAAIALGATLAALVGASALQLPAVPRADLGIAWTSFVRGPANFQREAIDALSGLVVGLAIAIVALGVLTVGTISLARASARRAELAVRRAVGATRSDLKRRIGLTHPTGLPRLRIPRRRSMDRPIPGYPPRRDDRFANDAN